MRNAAFFEVPDQQSLIKSKLVVDYFKAWSNVILPQAKRRRQQIAYVDLFAGPGRFKNGEDSTPLRILKLSIDDPGLRKNLVSRFNDGDPDHVIELGSAITSLAGISELAHQPEVTNYTIGTQVVDILHSSRSTPTLFFIDPFGYKGLSLDLVGQAIRNWGCDCIFFFNYNRINPGLSNPAVAELMNNLFGVGRTDRLRELVRSLSAYDREVTILNALAEALREAGGRFVLPFQFQSPHSERTSHYIIFVSKEFIGYHIMKDVMAKISVDDGDISNFGYVPVQSPHLQLLFEFAKPHSIPRLKSHLLQACAGKTLTVWDVYRETTVDTPYTLRNVQDALRKLESEQRIGIEPPAEKRRKHKGVVTLAKDKLVTFPS